MVEFCAERGLCVGNTYFKHKSLHKNTRVGKGLKRIDLVLVKKDMLHYVQDVGPVRRMG